MSEAATRYLTVQDMLWINLQVTKAVQSYRYAVLEEAVFYQYAYGSSSDVRSQSERFARRFAAKVPFAKGNHATGLAGVAAFLHLNGYRLDLDDASAHDWFKEVESGSGDYANRVVACSEHFGTVAEAVAAAQEQFPNSLARLAEE